jgi:tetratricopeptide (TPR) repeat protein
MKDPSSPITAFVNELRRRKVTRTGLTYAVGSWVVWQVIDVVSPALGWSDRVLSLVVVGSIALAPIVLVLAWVYEVRPELPPEPGHATGAGISDDISGERREEAGGDPPAQKQERIAPRRLLATTLPAAVLSATIAWALWPASAEGVGGFAEGDPTLISQCTNDTDDPGLHGVLNTALEAVLGQSAYVSVTSREQATAFALHYLNRETPVVVDRDLANELGVRWGLKIVIHCALRQIGDAYQVSASLTDPQGPNDLAVLTESARGPSDLVDAIDLLANHAREALGESLESVQESKPLAAVTTSSLEALKSFTAAVDAERAGDLDLALQLFRNAASRDTLFARAHSAIGSYLYRLGDRPGGAEAFRKALRRLDRVSDRDRIWIEASWASARADQLSAIGSYREYLQQWPDDPIAWYNLGTQYFRLGRCDDAGVAFGRALGINPLHAPSHVNLASCLAIAGNYDSSLVHYDSAFGIQPTWKGLPNVNHEYGSVLLRAGNAEAAERLFSEQAQADGEVGASGRRSAALLHMYAGRYRDAAFLLEEAARRRQALGQQLSEYRDRLFLAGAYDALNRRREVDEQVDRVAALAGEIYLNPSWLLYAIQRFLAEGRLDEARAFLVRAEADTLATSGQDQAAVLLARAEFEAVAAQPAGALESARLAVETGSNEMGLSVLCRLALRAGLVAEASRVCGELISEPRVGWEIQEPTLLTYFWLGRLAEQEGDAERAVELYTILAERWERADPGLVFRDLDGTYLDVLADTRARLAALNDAG